MRKKSEATGFLNLRQMLIRVLMVHQSSQPYASRHSMYGANNLTKKKMSKLPEATPEQRETLHQKAIGKHKETKTQYEVHLRYGDIEGEFTVDVREDIVTLDNDPVTEEYIEGFIYNTYDEAKKKYLEFTAQYDTLDTEIFTWNEVEDE